MTRERRKAGPIRFDVAHGGREVIVNGWRFRYSTKADAAGRFVVTAEKPVGKGSRSGAPADWQEVRRATFARREVAREHAQRWAAKRQEKTR